MVGKRVAGDLYVHKTAVKYLQTEDKTLVADLAKSLIGDEKKWNVVRISQDNVAFLHYPNFDELPFPVLQSSTRIDLFDDQKTTRDFSRYSNPPILHRKELLLPPSNKNRTTFEGLTKSLDELGVFYDPHKIGFKDQWEQRLRQHGIIIEGYKVAKTKGTIDVPVQRHKTAIVRYQLSQPVQLLMRFGLLTTKTSFFDYGCGRGDDIETLVSAGINASGWDPYYNMDAPLKTGQVVNIGFVLNVIEDIEERKEAVRNAWKLTKGVLSVAVMSPSSGAIENSRPFKDGFLTSRNTFQKYFSQEQLREFLAAETKEEPLAVAPGIFFIFANEVLKQEFQIKRYDRNSLVAVTASSQRERSLLKSSTKYEKALPILEDLSAEIFARGRLTHSNELPSEIIDGLKAQHISFKTAQHYCFDKILDVKLLEKIGRERRDDLILYFAIELFRERKPYGDLPKRLQQDLKTFFGNYPNSQVEARQLLFSIGDSKLIQRLCEEAADDGLGYLLPDNQLQFHQSALKQLPLALRCYVACGSILYGDIENADLIKIHIDTAKLSLMFYENFSDPLPLLDRRVKIDMRSQRVRIFNYTDRQYLYMKSLFLPDNEDTYEQQAKFDSQVAKLKEFDFSSYGPNADLFDQVLSEKNLKIEKHDLKVSQ